MIVFMPYKVVKMIVFHLIMSFIGSSEKLSSYRINDCADDPRMNTQRLIYCNSFANVDILIFICNNSHMRHIVEVKMYSDLSDTVLLQVFCYFLK